MKAKVGINGFGRIGRLFFRQAFENSSFEVVAVNDLGDIENLGYLLKYDTVYGRWDKSVEVKGDTLIIEGRKVAVSAIKEPQSIPWSDLGVKVIVESTGLFDSFEKARAHIASGASRVVITAPAKDAGGEGKTVLMGVNEGELKTTMLTSNGSCTTNAASPVIQILSENPGIVKAFLSTVHGYTATQNLVDGPVHGRGDFRRGRAAAQNIAPSSTGAAISVTRAIPELKGKFDGLAFRVPVPTGSLADITFVAKRDTSVEEINTILKTASMEPRWKGIFKVTEDQLVSSDIVGEPYGAIADLNFTKVIDGDLVKVISWYDNEWGYVSTLVRHVVAVASRL